MGLRPHYVQELDNLQPDVTPVDPDLDSADDTAISDALAQYARGAATSRHEEAMERVAEGAQEDREEMKRKFEDGPAIGFTEIKFLLTQVEVLARTPRFYSGVLRLIADEIEWI